MKPVRLIFPEAPGARRSWQAWHSMLAGRVASRHAQAAALLAAAAALAALCLVAVQSWDTHQQLQATRQAVEALQQKQARAARRAEGPSAEGRSAAPALTAQQTQAWNQLLRQLNTPWSAILDTLETATPQTVALVSIEPDARQASLRLQAEARTLETLLAYAGALNHQGPFGEVRLIKHETQDQDPNQPVRLSMDIRLKDPAR